MPVLYNYKQIYNPSSRRLKPPSGLLFNKFIILKNKLFKAKAKVMHNLVDLSLAQYGVLGEHYSFSFTKQTCYEVVERHYKGDVSRLLELVEIKNGTLAVNLPCKQSPKPESWEQKRNVVQQLFDPSHPNNQQKRDFKKKKSQSVFFIKGQSNPKAKETFSLEGSKAEQDVASKRSFSLATRKGGSRLQRQQREREVFKEESVFSQQI